MMIFIKLYFLTHKFFFKVITRGVEIIMSVHADGLMKKAQTQMKNNYKETGIYETNIQRERREK